MRFEVNQIELILIVGLSPGRQSATRKFCGRSRAQLITADQRARLFLCDRRPAGAGAQLGSISTRIDLQEDFVGAPSNSIDSGVGRLVDADMEEESSKLSALQTQQLAIQSLSIANSCSQDILSILVNPHSLTEP
ncbi:hypothetical protein ABID08_005476 [Rhizobium binae]|uniref:Flagellin C-terminal domain-containing protein n=1 Tax=Rhizobium binae TaxID=1138190 RepID=A0ABV2MNS7_9HYPH